MKVTNIKKLWIKFIGGGLIKFPHENLREVEIEGDGLDGGGGGQEETDEVKIYLDELATKIKSSGDYISYQRFLSSLMSKEEYIENPIPEEAINQGTIKGDINNFDYILFDFSDNNESELPDIFVFITEEQLDYFKKSVINISTKDFIISSLMIDDLEQVFGGIDLSGENAVKNQLAIEKEDFKFAINLPRGYIVLDDIDLSHFNHVPGQKLIVFDENETRKIFTADITSVDDSPGNKFSYLEIKSNDYAGVGIKEIDNKNYKYVDLSIPK